MNKKLGIVLLIAASWLAGYCSKPITDDETTAGSHPPIWRPAPVTLATEGAAPADKTCDTINLNGREWGLPFYVIDRAGTQCHRVIGAPKDPDVARLCPTAGKVQS